MTPQIRLKKQQLADLQRVREIGPEGISRLVDAVSQLQIGPLEPQALREILRKSLNGNESVADTILRTVLSLHGLRRQLDLKSDEIFQGLSLALNDGWDIEEVKKWEQTAPAFRTLFELPTVQLTAKALDLSYQHAHLLQRAQIVTDIRPLFNHDAMEIQGTIISHKLLLRYDDLEGEHSLSLAVDEKDIRAIINQCKRALQKSITVQKQLMDKADLQTLIPGKEDE